jgi:hypothetical protein
LCISIRSDGIDRIQLTRGKDQLAACADCDGCDGSSEQSSDEQPPIHGSREA